MPEPIARQNVPTNTALCPDWVFANNSNVVVAKDREWFQDYTPFTSRLPDVYGMNPAGAEVVGIGTVELMLKKHPNRSGRHNHTKLLLADVLHVPTASCNFFGMDGLGDVQIIMCGMENCTRGHIETTAGHRIGYFQDKSPFFRLQLSGQPVGPSLLEDGGIRLINAAWPESERKRWDRYKQNITVGELNRRASEADIYTGEEKAWLKKNYESEFKFLMVQGLSIYKDNDREEGRRLLRAFMNNDDSEDEVGEPSEDEEEEEEDEEDLEGHMADYGFSHEGLDWIAKHYGNSMNFMASFGLKFYDADDQTEARQLVEDFMKESS